MDEDITIARPNSQKALKALHQLCLVHGREMAPASVNESKVWERLLYAFENPDSFVMLLAVRDDELVGYLNLQRAGWWFGDEEFLCDFGFYVLPSYRGGDVGTALLKAAKITAETLGMHLRICVTNPGRRRGRMNKEAEIIGFTPLGAMMHFGNTTSYPPFLN